MPGLFDTLEVAGTHLRNRIVMPPMDMQHATARGEVTDRAVESYRKRAAGGVGLVIVEHSYVRPEGKIGARQLGIYDDSLVAGLGRLVDAIKGNGAVAAIQISHGGRTALPEVTRVQPVAPSALTSPGDPVMPRALTTAEVRDFVESYGDAGRRAHQAGFDAVEIHGAHGYLVNQFVSPFSNRRVDEFGGTEENRFRFPLEIVRSIKRKAGADFLIFYRLSASEYVPGGLSLSDTQALAKRLAEAGVKVMDVSSGVPASSFLGKGQVEALPGYMVPLAAGIKSAVTAPVMAVGRLNSPLMAADIVAGNQADLVAFGRALLKDPNWAANARQALETIDLSPDGARFLTYRAEMVEMLETRRPGALREFCRRWSAIYRDHILEKISGLSDDRLQLLIHKSVCVSLELGDLEGESRSWLEERGYSVMPD